MPKTKKTKPTKRDAGYWPPEGVTEHDVLQGRGGKANNWRGNKEYRRLVDDKKEVYVNSKRAIKTAMSKDLVRVWRAKNPPGRFLEQDNSGLWRDIGDQKARRKTSQLLREDAPKLRETLAVTSSNDSATDGTDATDNSQGQEDEEGTPKKATAQTRQNGNRRFSERKARAAAKTTGEESETDVLPPPEPTRTLKVARSPNAAALAPLRAHRAAKPLTNKTKVTHKKPPAKKHSVAKKRSPRSRPNHLYSPKKSGASLASNRETQSQARTERPPLEVPQVYDADPNAVDHNNIQDLVPIDFRASAIGSNDRDISLGSMSSFLQLLEVDEINDTSALTTGNVDRRGHEIFGGQGLTGFLDNGMEPLNFDSSINYFRGYSFAATDMELLDIDSRTNDNNRHDSLTGGVDMGRDNSYSLRPLADFLVDHSYL